MPKETESRAVSAMEDNKEGSWYGWTKSPRGNKPRKDAGTPNPRLASFGPSIEGHHSIETGQHNAPEGGYPMRRRRRLGQY